MNRAYLLFLAILAISLSLIFSLKPATLQAGTAGLNTQLLSDHSLTEADTIFNIYGYGIDTANNVAHIYWHETGNGSEGTDLFYRQLPGGSTIRLSDPALSEGDVSQVWFDTAVAPDGTFHMIWLEDTNSAEGGDLFYWSAATGTLRLSDHTETEGYVQPAYNTLFITLDNNGNPHTFWHEETGTSEGEDLFFWSLATGTILLTDRSQTEGNDVMFGNQLLIDDKGTSHIIWAEYGNDGVTDTYFYWNESLPNPIILPQINYWVLVENVAHIIWLDITDGPISYWNSTTQTIQPIPSSADLPGGSVLIEGFLVDSAGNIHILWSKDLSNICLAHWDSGSQTTEEAVSGESCKGVWPVHLDGSDVLHAVVSDDPGGIRRFRYWNENLTNPIDLPVADVSIYGWLTGIEGTNIVHFSWIEFGGTDDNFFHWDNINQTTSNLSQLAGNDTRISSTGRQVEQSSNGELYMLWSEQINATGGTLQNLYWNSVINTTQNLFTELGISSINPVNSGTENMRMDFLASGEPYFMWHGVPNSGPEGLYLWDSSQDTIHLAGESYPCSEVGGSYKNDSDNFGNIYLAWQDDATRNYHFWSQATGEVALSQTAAAETGCHPPVLTVAENGSVFVLWVEESDIAGEGLDIFAGWIESTISKIYLPLVAKP
ncbi:hypothetical protein [Candidatus Leptofilum sp.]|uniref:hypothetical protein n=1 Tax=Candidatus Leptofilum sp. TaxID=3241576 RepID=UPI003B5CE188